MMFVRALVPTIVSKRQGILDQARYDDAGGIETLDVGATPLPVH